MPKQIQHGFTAIELMVTIAVIAVLITVAVPSFTDMLERKRLQGAAETVKSELQYARSEAIKQSCQVGNFTTSVSFIPGTAWQLLISCNGATVKTVNSPSDNVTLGNITFTGDDVAFDSRRGSADESVSVTLSTDNYSLIVRVINNRVLDICYPAAFITGYGEC